MLQIDPVEYGNQNLFKLLLSGIAPRPIAFASTVDKDGNNNLAPFSFYNSFGVNPSTLIFSPSRRGRDNTTKHTLENLKEVPEVVINAVSYNMVQQMSLASTEYEKGVDEFIKSGFDPLPSKLVKPKRVAQSPLQFECKVRDIIEISGQPGSGNLVISEIVYIHLDENVLDHNGDIDPNKIDLVGRLGGDYYTRTSGDANFIVPKPLVSKGIGVDALPESIRLSEYLTGNDLGQLGNLDNLTSLDEINRLKEHKDIIDIIHKKQQLHQYARSLISANRVSEALAVLLLENLLRD
jgi:flavin reductase (DIM6/NTAB) family NADH-FMN oxidoreductase RutF